MTYVDVIERAAHEAVLPFTSDRDDIGSSRSDIGVVTLCAENADDVAAREKLLDEVMPSRHTKTCEKFRVGREPAEGLSFVARDDDGAIVGTVRLWHVVAGAGRPALLLGPLAVAASHRSRGLGGRLMRLALANAKARGHRAVLLVGDAPYYGRFGFERQLTLGLALPGPVENDRFLALELEPGALDGARGLVRPTGLRTHGTVRRARPALSRAA